MSTMKHHILGQKFEEGNMGVGNMGGGLHKSGEVRTPLEMGHFQLNQLVAKQLSYV